MNYQATTKQIAFVLPSYFAKAEITFSRITGRREEVTVAVPPGEGPRHLVSTSMLERGLWKAQLNWAEGKTWFFSEQWIEVA